MHWIKIIKLNLFILHNLYSRRKNSKVWLFRKGLARIRRVFWRISVSSKWCSCCFVARASKPEAKLPAGDFHGGVGRDETRPLVRLSVSSVGWKGSCCAVHDSRMWNWKPRCTPIISPTTLVHPLEYIWPFGVYRGAARHLAVCAMIRSIRSLFFPIPLRISSPTPLRSEDSGCAVWGMTIHFLRFWLCEGKFVQDSEDFV